jgi:hypothetical protein
MNSKLIKFRNGKTFILTETSIQSVSGKKGNYPNVENDRHGDVYSFISDNPGIVYLHLKNGKFYATSVVGGVSSGGIR